MIHVTVALFLLLTVVLGMVRIVYGPTVADRMMAAQLFGTSGLAILLVLAWGMDMPELIDIALTFSLLATLATMTFVRRVWYEEGKSDDS
ncbi:MAG: monovalent cation/H+ antiporter complex subunit F [Desulfobulbaceae bacterium]|jgi:multicomponent Na+:H+ antiporter subunit F|nr:monovalent cation/H+ antiporter complex subunit F [Desulfobulbaceae bacterium]MDY0351142.1 monovalent cation/H+ antiporter complex subunit F [Desulfobulbaceae bacterium]